MSQSHWHLLFSAFVVLLSLSLCRADPPAVSRAPNIVLIVGEDMGTELRCYGDANALTPNMDRLAAQGARFTRCFTHAPVCAPSRSGLITGRYPTSIGTHHMRSTLLKPPPMFTDYLKKAGYTIAWPTRTSYGKTDFNFNLSLKAFDITIDWTKEIPKQPFFGFYNIFTSHESQIRAPAARFAKNTERLQVLERRDPAKMKLPPYYPDTPEVRRDLANYYELVTAVDYQVGVVLDALEKAGIADNTIVVLTGDHGRGLPRSKRWVYNQGIHVPLIVRWPGHIKPGTVRQDLVCFLDFAPTMLALAGAEVPKEMQGQIILGPKMAPERKYIFAARDRMDETYDRIRTVRDKHYQYIRNFEPDLPYAQRVAYGELMPTMIVWRKLHAEGKLNAVQDQFFASTKPREELYDVDADPDEVHNLASDPKYKNKLVEMRTALDRWIEETKDLGAIPERELIKRSLVADRLSDDWPQFLGPQRNSTSTETGLLQTWNAKGPPVLWQKEVGEGFSAPVVAGERLILFHRVGDEEIVECLDAANGKEIWKHRDSTHYSDPLGKGDGPRSTPLIAGGRVYTLSPGGRLLCLKLAGGNKVWQRDLLKDYNVPRSYFGVGTSPILEGGRLLVNVGGRDAGIVAFDKDSGKEVWKATGDGASYSSPVAANIDGVRHVVFFTRQGIVSLDPANGRVRFSKRWRSRMDASVNAAAPVVVGDALFFTACYETGAILVRAKKDGFEELWSNDRSLSCHFSTPVHHEGCLYGFDGRQESGTEFRCIEAKTGKVHWSKEGFGCGSMILAEGNLIVLSEGGELVLVECKSDKYREKARAAVLSGPCRAHMALADGRLYARDSAKLVCWNITK